MASNQPHQDIDTIIGPNTTIKGDLTFSGNMHLLGSVEGSIVSTTENDTLIISDSGRINGSLKTGNLNINGTVEGDITVTGKMEVNSKARINGNIFYVNIEMETGSQVNGKLIYQGGDVTPISNKKAEKDGK
ncbi:polymer-forming cytoskeletal protein [Marinicella sediminis]|uniref:Polymer-forming cytoskeletal protein n=2 Tax=Marinicella sediminis TaxID=1792834 RepID=A0ABV7J9K8_9GAMM